MTNYRRGYDFERKCADALKELGAAYVIRSAGSKGKVDLLALWSLGMVRRPWAVQCKRDGRLPKGEREALLELHDQTGAIPVLAKAGKRGEPVVFQMLKDAA